MLSTRRALAAVVSVATLLAASACGSADEDPGATKVEVFTWWAEGGEKAGLDALVSRFTTDCAGQRFEDGVVAGGAGINAKEVLNARIEQNDPPDTYQVHAGAELADYIAAGRVQDLSAEYDSWGLRQALPQGLIDDLTVDGKIYSVPANIHRANVVWANSQVLAGAGILRTPRTLDAFLKDLAKLRKAGIESPLALGRDWTQLMVLESVLISDLGPKRFAGLFAGTTNWRGKAVTTALNHYAQLLSYSNPDRDSLDWPEAERLLIDGQAGYQVMGDWEAADLEANNFRAYEAFPFPGNDGVFQWLADSFVLPTGAGNAEGTRCWLKTVASADGQREFNLRKGSIPARTDVTGAGFSAYQVEAMKDWKSDTPVPSCAHGSACPQDWQNAMNAVLGGFSTSAEKNITQLQNALAATADQYAKG
ncbi:ABC transporter substrate-binding protein [Actinoplanes aureus]|jgi:glucose/mannose transport system substrate-binding protein|uniref:Probable sugar-binding periplasmic protein n=1 Tax=Actinoplanes aureus TaxID=2792083 RepID=A0A931C6G9_9ACTN|nr:ABC transporter substrate-binding protein [Actinoplanes aureus]MBG0560343.1 carbohydrate ABC transporter substrate-binding protein [Actinoplanes aureus]